MTWEKVVHRCVPPSLHGNARGYDVGSIWQCDECGTRWIIASSVYRERCWKRQGEE